MMLTPVLVGLITGVLSGLLGVGGGIILIPMLVLGLNIPQHLAQGVSLAVIIPTAFSGLITFHRKGLIDYRMAGLLATGSIIGILISGNYVHLIPSHILKRIFGFFLIFIGLRMIITTDKVIYCIHWFKHTYNSKQSGREKGNNQEMEDNDGKK